MPKSIVAYSVLISCPSDVLEFLSNIEEAVDSFNRSFGVQNGIRIDTTHWSKNSYSYLEKGLSGQDVINKQIVENSDMLIGVFWNRFGTPTEKYGSGTEEEINQMLDSKKPVILYFLDKPISPSKIDIEQLSRVREFKKKLSTQKYGLYFCIDNESSLAIKLRDQLEMCFTKIMSQNKDTVSTTDKYHNKLSVLWVDDRPENNTYGRLALEASGIEVITALSTSQALSWLENNKVSVIISDMGRKEGKKEGYILLDQLRKNGNQTPYIIFAGSRSPEHIAEVERHGGQGCTNNFDELIYMVKSFVLDTNYQQYSRR